MSRRRRNPISPNWITWALIAAGVFIIYKMFSSAKTVLVNAQQAAGSTLADAIQFVAGTGIASPGEVYSVTMPDGSVQTVPYGQLPVAGAPLPPVGIGTQ